MDVSDWHPIILADCFTHTRLLAASGSGELEENNNKSSNPYLVFNPKKDMIYCSIVYFKSISILHYGSKWYLEYYIYVMNEHSSEEDQFIVEYKITEFVRKM
ncbi:unnamed protein product [Schistosoma margrebowiei]|uniref:Uncharacterized protein n=1 Tax=Schistosoma margrebowiei TaxID=48269 RepID=A0AA84ZYR8_9TREM|nr:unnamed protein product [Schistosoma margrebowiei]